MNEKNNKIFLLRKIVFIIAVLLLLISKSYADDINNDKLLVISNIDTWEYKNGTWYKKNTLSSKSYFSVYVDNKYHGVYKINETYNLYDNDNNIVHYNGELFAYTNNFNIKNKEFNIDKITDEKLNEINSILGTTLENKDLSINEYIKVDLDNNGINDEIISISNLDALDEQSKYFNLIYIKLNNKDKQVLVNDTIPEKEVLNAPIYQIKYIFNLNNNYDNIIFEEGYFSNANNTKNIMYENINESYSKVVIEKEQEKTNTVIKKDYTLYIVLAIVLIIFFIGYFIFNKIKNKEDVMDD